MAFVITAVSIRKEHVSSDPHNDPIATERVSGAPG